ncbi:MAG: ESPR-type extended signal peptide-containing protein [Mitsuokella sp.]|uniref:ESPR-type extended signal peptide-containing protein n=1 Tax=Mitsuokella sp. TaxID=2049034 RepID=UPI003F017B8C
MNKIYKVIYNRARNMYQVVSEIVHSRGKTRSLQSRVRPQSLARLVAATLLAMSIGLPVGWAADGDSAGTTTSDTTTATATYISDTNTADENIKALDTQVAKNAADISTNKTNIATNTADIATNKESIAGNKTAIDTNTKNIATNKTATETNATNIAANKTATETNATNIAANKTATETNATNIAANKTSIEKNATDITTNANNIATNKSDISNLKNLSNITDAGNTVIKKQAKQAVKVAATGNATVSTTGSEDDGSTLTYTINVANNGAISVGDTNLVSGDTLYTELRPTSGTYISAGNTTAANLISLDTNLVNVVNALGLDINDTTTSYTSKMTRYFKVNPEVTTSTDGTKTYATDASVNGTNSLAIGPSAKVDTAATATALGNGATVNKTATSGLAIGNGATTGATEYTKVVNDTTSVTVAAAGGENSVAIGTSASAAGNTSIALGNGASVTNDTDGNYQAVVKSDDIAIGTKASTAASDSSTAIGKSATVSESTDAVAIGSSATASSSKDALVLGKEAKATSAADSIAMGTSAAANSADVVVIGSSTSATGANSVVIGKSAQTTSEGGNAIGSSSTASGRSTAIGQSATANNFDALAIGNGATANADRSISLGYKAGVGTTEGKGEPQTSGSLIAIGTEAGNDVAGMQNIAIGSSAGNKTKSNYNVAIGSSAGYNISYADDSLNQNGYNVSIGYQANYQSSAANIMNAISIGEKTNAENYAVAIGGEAQATGTNSMALGYTAQAAGTDSVSLGRNASSAGGNVAIGAGSAAPAVSTLGTVQTDSKGNSYLYKATTSTGSDGSTTTTYTEYKSAFTYKPLSANSTYVSVGDSTGTTALTRRISNVADGVFDSDAATVGQLNSLNELLQATDTKVGLTKDYFEQKFTDLNTNIDSVKPHYFAISSSSENLTDNYNNTGATANMADAMAIGPNANATNKKTLAIGNNVYATGLRSIAIGTADNPSTDSSGTKTTHNTSAEGENSIALGTSTTAQSDNSVAIGTRAQTYTTDTTKGSITGVKAVAIGYSATTAGDTSVAVGNNATVKYASGTAVGTDSLADGTNAVAIGEGSKAYSDNSTAIGQGNSITGNNTYGLGSSNTVSGAWGGVTTSGVSGYNNSVTSISDANTKKAISGIYMTGNSNSLTQNVVDNNVSDITVTGSDNKIDAGAGGTSSHPNTVSQISIVGSSNTVQGKSSDNGLTNNIKNVTILGYNNKVDANTDTNKDFSNTQILGNNVTAGLGNSVYLGNNAAYVGQTMAKSDAITAAKTAADTAAEASDEYAAATTDTEKAQIKAKYEAQYLYELNVEAMEASGTTAGTQSYSTDKTYGDDTSYTYAGSSPTGVITVGKVGGERRIQNVAAGLVSASSTDAVNGSQLYALTRQLRFGGDNSTFGADSAADTNVIARGSAQTLAITGGGVGVTTTNTDGVTTTTVDSTKLTDKNISVIADTDDNALNIKLASNLTSLNTAQLGSGSGTSYQETIKLDGTGTNGGTLTLDDAKGANGVTLRTSGSTTTKDLSGTAATRLLVNDKTVATMDDGLTVGGDSGTDSNLKLNSKLTIKGGINSQNAANRLNDTNNNIGVTSDGNGTLTVKLSKDVVLGNYQSGTETTDKSGTLRVNGGSYYSINNGSSISLYKSTGTADGSSKSPASDDTLGVTMGITKANGGYIGLFDGSGTNEKYIFSGDTENGIPRIQYNNGTKTGTTYSLATLNDGTNYKDDAGNSISVALNKTLTLSGGATTDSTNTAANWTTGNISVVSSADTTDGTANGNGTMSIRLAKNLDLSSDGSLKTGNTTINNSGLTNGSTTLNGTGLTITNGPSVTTSGITANGKIAKVTAGTDNTDAANVAQIKAATTEVEAGDNVSVTNTPGANQQNVYKVSVNNLAVKANGEGTTTVALANGLNFKNGTNTTAAVASDGTVTISATHNKLTAVTAEAGDKDNVTLTLKDADGNEVASTGLKNTVTTVSKNGTDHTVTFARNDGVSETLSLGDLNGASKDDLTTSVNTLNSTIQTAAAKATSTVVKGNNVDSVTDDTNSADGHHIYTVNVSDLAVKTTDGEKKSVKLADGLVFADGDNTTATVGDNGTIKYNVSNAAIKAQAKEAVDVKSANSFATVSADTTDPSKTTFTITATHNKLTSGEVTTAATPDSNAVTMTLKDADGNEVTTSGLKDTYTTITKDTEAKTVKFHRNDGTDTTLSLSDFGAASTTDMNQAVAAATTEIKAGTNASLGTTTTDATDKHKIYTLNVDNLSVAQNNTKVGTGVALKDGLSFNDGTNTTASVTADGKVSFNVSNDAIKAQAKNAVSMNAGDNVKIGAPTETDTSKTYTISVDNLKLQANSVDAGSRKLADGLNFANGTNTTAAVDADGKITYGLNDSISLTQVTTGNSSLSNEGLKITNGPSVLASGINAGDKVITNVASGGDTDTNAANISDVKRLVNAASSTTATTGFKVKGDDTTAKTVQLGKQLNVTGGATSDLTDGNVGVTTSADEQGNATLSVKLKKDINLGEEGSIQTGATTMNNAGITNGNMSLGASGLTITGGPSVTTSGIDAGSKKITGVEEGTADTDAVNVKQLNALTSKVDSAAWTIEDADHTENAQTVKAGDTVALKAGDNLSLSQDGKTFTYSLNKVVTGMTSVTAVDDKQNTAVLNGEGLKVSDRDGNSLTQHATEVRLHDANKAADDTTTDVVLNKQGLQNGGHTITGVADGKVVAGSQEAVNGGQLYALQQKVGSGWKITGNNTASTTSIGADKTVSFINGKNSTVTVSGSDSGATVKVDVDTATLSTKDNKAVASGSGVADAGEVADAINNAAWNVQKAGSTAQTQQVKAGSTVTFGNDDNLTLTQNGTAFTYGLASNVNIATIRLGGTKGADGVWTGGIYIGKQVGGGANTNDGNYITGLGNTAWDLSKVVDDRAATEGQLKAAINQVTIASQSGGFGLRDADGNTVTQMLGQTVSIVGDTEYAPDGKTITKQGNITTEADSKNIGGIKVKLSDNVKLADTGSLTVGQSKVTNGKVELDNTTDTSKKIMLDSSTGTAAVGGVIVNGSEKTVTGLSNTNWDATKANVAVSAGGYQGSTKAATESQLAAAISQATTTAQNNELHVQAGTYNVTTKTDAQTGAKTNSVTMNIVDGAGATKGQVVINDVAKASDLGDTTQLADAVKTKNGDNYQTTSVVEAVNNLNTKVDNRVGDNQYSAVTNKDIDVQDGDSSTTAIAKLNKRMTDIYTTAGQHTTVSNSDKNLILTKTENGATNYQIDLNKEKLDLGNVTIKGNEGSIAAKSMTADTFTAGSTVVNNDGVKVGDKSALTGDTLKVNGKTYVSGDGINANSQKITNVADGSNDGDAVNVKQVNELAAQQNAAINQNASNINQLDRAVNRLDSRINRVGAGAAALAALHPGDYDPNDKVDFAAGFGNYRGASAAAVGVYYHPDETTTMSVGASFGGGENMVNAGVTWKMGKDSGHMRKQAVRTVPVQFVAANTAAAVPVSAANAAVKTPAPTTTTTTTTAANGQQVPIVAAYLPSPDSPVRAENDELKELLARQTAILEKLTEQKTGQPAAAAPAVSGDDLYPDVPENHWAYDFVGKLAKAGVLKGCSVEDPVNNPMLTRNDFAQILYTALKNGATKDPALNKDGGLNHLASEFRAELKNVKR